MTVTYLQISERSWISCGDIDLGSLAFSREMNTFCDVINVGMSFETSVMSCAARAKLALSSSVLKIPGRPSFSYLNFLCCFFRRSFAEVGKLPLAGQLVELSSKER